MVMVTINDDVRPGEGDIVLDFSESVTVRKIFSKLGALQCLYTVQIIPRTDQDSVEVGCFPRLFNPLAIIIFIMCADVKVFVFEQEDHRFLSSISLFRTRCAYFLKLSSSSSYFHDGPILTM